MYFSLAYHMLVCDWLQLLLDNSLPSWVACLFCVVRDDQCCQHAGKRIGLVWNCLPRVKILLGGWPKNGQFFICLPPAALFSSNLPVSFQFRGVLSLFNVQEHSFHQFQGLKHPGEQSILIIHFTHKVNNLNVFFHPIWFWLFYSWKVPEFGKSGAYDYLIKIGLLWSRLPPAKKSICRGLVLWSFGNTDDDSSKQAN